LRNLHVHVGDAGDVAARPIEAGHEAHLDRVAGGVENNWNRRRRCPCRECRRAARCGDGGHLAAHQIGRQFRKPIRIILARAELDRQIATFEIAGFV